MGAERGNKPPTESLRARIVNGINKLRGRRNLYRRWAEDERGGKWVISDPGQIASAKAEQDQWKAYVNDPNPNKGPYWKDPSSKDK